MAGRRAPGDAAARPLPTPVLAWTITELDAAAGVMVTASHNPPADNGYKVYLGDGAQIVPPHDVEISARIDAVDPTTVPLAADDDPLIERLDDDAGRRATSPPCAAVRLRPDVAGVPVAYTAMHGVGGDVVLRAFERGRARRRRTSSPSSSSPTRRSRRCRSRTRRSRGRWTCCIALARRARRRAGARQRSRRRPARRGDPAARRLVAAARRRRDRLAARRPHPAPHDGRRPARRHDARVVVAARRDGRRPRRALRRDVHRVQVDRPDGPRPPRAAVRVRLRAGARLPRGAAPARQGRHHGGGDAGRGRRRSPRPRDARCRTGSTTSPRGTAGTSSPSVGAAWTPAEAPPSVRARCRPTRRTSSPACRGHRRRGVPGGRPAAPRARGRRPPPGPPERHRAEGQALRRGRRRRPGPLPRRAAPACCRRAPCRGLDSSYRPVSDSTNRVQPDRS